MRILAGQGDTMEHKSDSRDEGRGKIKKRIHTKHEPKMNHELRNVIFIGLGLGVALLIYWAVHNKPPSQQLPTERAEPSPRVERKTAAESRIPPYYKTAEAAKPFPSLVPAAYFRRYPLVERAYQIAAEIPEVIAQQPCYCYCEGHGHHSLLDCYASDHGAG
jgi:hypothetical protein